MQTIEEIFEDGHKEVETIIGYETPQLMEEMRRRRLEAEHRLFMPDSQISSQTIIETRLVGRNQRCPCNSGKKFKKCCGANYVVEGL